MDTVYVIRLVVGLAMTVAAMVHVGSSRELGGSHDAGRSSVRVRNHAAVNIESAAMQYV